jgi:hypothetical protein
MSSITWTLCQICLFEFIRVEGGVNFMNHVDGGTSYKRLGASSLTTDYTIDLVTSKISPANNFGQSLFPDPTCWQHRR